MAVEHSETHPVQVTVNGRARLGAASPRLRAGHHPRRLRAGGPPKRSPRPSPAVAARRRRRLRPSVPALLVGLDVVAAVLAVLIVGEASRRVFIVAALTIALFGIGGLYRSRLVPSVLDDLPRLAGRVLVAGALVTTAGVWDDGASGKRPLLFAAVFLTAVFLLRACGYALVRWTRGAGIVRRRTLVLGAGEVAGQLAENLLEHPEIGLEPIGFLDDDPLLAEDRRPVPLLGGSQDLVDVILDREIDNVVVAFGSLREPSVVDVLRACDRLACEIFIVPRLYELHPTGSDMEMVWGIPLMRMRRAAFRTPGWRVKRAMDVVLGGTALVAALPVLAVVAAAVRIWIGSPVLFKQQRVGLDGRPFTVLKFCSLRPADPSEANQMWNVGLDDRLTPLGRFIRRFSLDELPQLWNVLRGDMSLVGPRPERPYFVEQFTGRFPRYMARHRVPAGLTGYAQVHGLRGDTSIADRAKFDNHYIENWSPWLDVKILLLTAGQVLKAGGR